MCAATPTVGPLPPVPVYIGALQPTTPANRAFRAQQVTEVAEGDHRPRDYGHPRYGYSVCIFPLNDRLQEGFFMWPTSPALAQWGGMDAVTLAFSHLYNPQNGSPLGEFFLSEAEHTREVVRAAVLCRCNPGNQHVADTHRDVVRQDLGIPVTAFMENKTAQVHAGIKHPVLVSVCKRHGPGGGGGEVLRGHKYFNQRSTRVCCRSSKWSALQTIALSEFISIPSCLVPVSVTEMCVARHCCCF